MATPVWGARPTYTEAQIKARFGAGARIVRRGDGKWTIAGAAPAPAPSAATPAPPPPPPPAVSFGAQAGIDSLTDRISAQPGIFNPQRLALYAEGARGFTDQGYYDTATADVSSTTADGSTSYRIVAGPDGQLYREAVNDTAAAANSRGMLFSSARREQENRRRTDLNNARERMLRGLSGQQDALTAQQLETTTSLRGDLNTRQGEYTDWKASQPVPVPPAPAPAAAAAPPAPAGPPGPNNPRSGQIVLPGPPAPPKVTHRRQGVRR